MKNIHILPTDKPSRLFIDIDDNKLKITKPLGGRYMMNQNIYITSDEKIKEGDWYIADDKLYRASVDHMPELYTYPCKKIILTTDQDLIDDGVQAIDDKFLEWFVNNPSCEQTKVEQDIIGVKGGLEFRPILGYKIIILKEETKQERMYSEEEVELIANEMVNWAIDNVGNPNPQSGKKFDEVIIKFKNK